MKFLKKPLFLVFISLFVLQGCNDDDSPTLPEEVTLSETITITSPGLYPGKFDFNTRNNMFVVGSVLKSEVGLVTPETGEYRTFINDPGLALVTGIRVDNDRNRLIVTSGDFGWSYQSVEKGQVGYVGIYNSETGEKITGIDLRAMSTVPNVFPNDIAVDNDGNIYITDSYASFMYKVDGTTLEASIWLEGGDDFAVSPTGVGGLGMNGLEFKDDFLIAAKTDTGDLFKIPINNPTAYTKIEGNYRGMDGLKWGSNGDLYMAETGLGGVQGARVIASDDNWDTTYPVLLYELTPAGQFPTSVCIAHDGNPYFITAKLGQLVTGNENPQELFNIYRIPTTN